VVALYFTVSLLHVVTQLDTITCNWPSTKESCQPFLYSKCM